MFRPSRIVLAENGRSDRKPDGPIWRWKRTAQLMIGLGRNGRNRNVPLKLVQLNIDNVEFSIVSVIARPSDNNHLSCL